MRAAHQLVPGERPGAWSISAFALSVLGVAFATWLIVSSDGDPSDVRWPLVVLPVGVCALPVLFPTRRVRIGASVVLALWCLLTGLSIGLLLLPAYFVLLGAVLREGS